MGLASTIPFPTPSFSDNVHYAENGLQPEARLTATVATKPKKRRKRNTSPSSRLILQSRLLLRLSFLPHRLVSSRKVLRHFIALSVPDSLLAVQET